MRKLAIIDPVGMKAGMNCYDLGLLNALQKDGVEVYAFSNFNDGNYPRIHQYPLFLKEKKGALSNIVNFIAAHFHAVGICKKEKINWVILHVFSTTLKDVFSFYILRFFKIRIVAIVHDVSSLSDENNATYRNKMYAMAKVLVVHNQTSYEEIVTLLKKDDKKKLAIIPHGNYIDFTTQRHSSQHFENLPSFDTSYKYLLFFGQIKKVKGLDVLLRAIPFLPPDFKVIIAGRPHRDDFAYYEDIINELDINDKVIKCIRFIKDEERDYLFKHCDALILPYRKIFQSGVLLLSMSYGLPVIASDLPANKEIITDGENGILFKDGDPSDLADKIRTLFTYKGINILKDNTIATAKDKYSWSGIAKSYEKYLEQ